MRLSIFHSTSRALREFFLVLVQGYERAPRVSQLPNYYTDNKFNKTLCQEIYLNWGEYSVSNGISIGEASKSERLSGSRIALFMYYETHLN